MIILPISKNTNIVLYCIGNNIILLKVIGDNNMNINKNLKTNLFMNINNDSLEPKNLLDVNI
jgi:hypothetical protein